MPLKVNISGGKPAPPVRIIVPKGADLAKLLRKQLEMMDSPAALVLSAQTGQGKTHGILHGVVLWAQENGRKVVLVSSRVAINTQVKKELIEVTGQANLKDELTKEGIRVREEFGPVCVITYHRLYWLMVNDPDYLKDFDVLVFDEVHALLEDAMFVGFSGYVLNNLKHDFSNCIRLYMTATPDDILPLLLEIEAPRSVTVLHMPRDYSYVVPHFFSEREELIKLINTDASDHKWLIYIPYISMGKSFCKKLEHPWCMLNGEVREAHPDKWYEILDNQAFPEKVCVVTSIIDAGVNFRDDKLTNVVVFSTSPTTIIQVLGRKRRKCDEKVHLYSWCPMPCEIEQRLEYDQTKREALLSFWTHRCRYISQHILSPQKLDLRSLMYLHNNGEMEPNPLANVQLKNEINRLTQVLCHAQKHKDPACFDRFVCRWLRISVPERSVSWLDAKYSGNAKREFTEFLIANCGVEMDEEAFTLFAAGFQRKCIAAFGKAAGGRDRDDRPWKETKLNNKLEELLLPYHVVYDKENKIYCLLNRTKDL